MIKLERLILRIQMLQVKKSMVMNFLNMVKMKSKTLATGVIVIAAKLSKADGQVTQDEVKKFREVFDFDPKDEVAIGKIFNSAKKSSDGYRSVCKTIVSSIW